MQADIFKSKKIILGITGCIAAYKSAYLLRELKKRGAEVKVIMTPSASEFIAPLTLSSLSHNSVVINMFPASQKDGTDLSTWHIDYALWADLMIIAPATVNTIAKIAHGFADNALTTLVTALRCPLLIAPAADVDMYEYSLTQKNIGLLKDEGYTIVEPEEGELASGLSGFGRLASTERITDTAEIILSGLKQDLYGKKIIVTAGPTYEDVDPVRFIGNRSSGKMGYAIARAARIRGAEVTLISGPTSEQIYPDIKLLKVRSADEMKKAVTAELKKNDILIMAAAVADYKPVSASKSKLKKEDKLKEIKLEETIDILSSIDKKGKTVAGFALETDNELKNAALKLKKKGLDLIVLNSLKDKNSGFEFDSNKITVLRKNGTKKEYPLQSKFQAANKILNEVITVISK